MCESKKKIKKMDTRPCRDDGDDGDGGVAFGVRLRRDVGHGGRGIGDEGGRGE